MKMSRQLTKQRIPLRQEDLRSGLIHIFLFDRLTEFLALYGGSYGVRPSLGWGGGGAGGQGCKTGPWEITGHWPSPQGLQSSTARPPYL